MRGAAGRARAGARRDAAASCSCSARGATPTHARELVARHGRRRGRRGGARARATASWDDDRSTRSRSSTPDDSFDLLMNRWLLYQDAELPPVGALGLLPAGRRVRLPRPAAGRDGARRCTRPDLAREHLLRAAAPPVRRGRRAALVARAERPRHAHALLGRPALAALRGGALRPHDRRRRRPRRAGAVPRGARRSRPTREEAYGQPRVSAEHGVAVRALPARHRPGPHRRAPTACR